MATEGPSDVHVATLLIVDDDARIRTMLRRVFEHASYQVLDAGDGRQALSVLESHPVDLLITDIIMPDTEGIELITRVRGRWADLPIIAMSGGGWIDPAPYLELARTLGADRIMSKPLNLELLLNACAEILKTPPSPKTP
ncbi:MAG: response regulator [Deltaproteobacteria bacterium]|nr:response regulator [Deltaproteobacteria bacterium]